MKKLIFTLFLVVTFGSRTIGQVLLEEQFNHAPGTLLNTVGWFAHSAGTTNPIAVGAGLSLAGTNYFGNGQGGSALVYNTGSDENKPFTAWADSGSLYASFLINLGYVPTTSTAGYFFHLGQYSAPATPAYTALSSSFRARLHAAPGDQAGKFKLGLTYSSATTPTTGLSQNLDTGTTYLVVVKYTFVAGALNDVICAYVFEPGALIASEPLVPTLGPISADLTETNSLQCVVLRQFNAAQRISVDGILVNRSWNIAPVSCPVPTALVAAAVDTTGATLNWNSGNGASYWLLEYAAAGSQPGTGLTVVSQSTTSTISGLTGSTAYTAWVRSVCTSGGTNDTSAYSAAVLFTTPGAQIPSVTTVSAVATGFNSAELNGEVTSTGGIAVSTRGFAWSRQSGPTTAGAVVTAGSGPGAYSASLTGIPLNTLFFVRAYATNPLGTAYGAELSFTTPSISRATGPSTALVEDFDYPAGALLRNNGWSVHSGGTTNPIAVATPGLSFAQSAYYGSNIGGCAQVVNTGADENRNFTQWIDSGAVYASFLLRGNATNASARGYFLHLAEYDSAANPVFGNVSSSFRGRTYITQGSSAATFRLGLAFNSATIPTTVGLDVTQDLDTAATYLVVLKYQFLAGDSNDVVSLYVFGDGDNIYQEPATPTLGPLGQTMNTTTGMATPDANIIQGIALRQFNAAQRVTVDGIRVRNHWDLTAQMPGGTLSGIVRYDNTAQAPLGNCSVQLRDGQGAVLQTTTTSATGSYQFNSVPAGSYTLSVSTTKPWGGVNSTDALNVARHFSSVASLPGIRPLVADVNASSSINSTDALRISQRTVTQITSFTAGDWYFQSPTVTVSGGTVQQPAIFALCYGDVNGSYNPPTLRSAPELAFAQPIEYRGGLGVGEVALIAPESMELGAVTLHISYPAEWGRAAFRSELLSGNLLWNDLGGQISVSWYRVGGQSIAAGSVLGVLQFENAPVSADFGKLSLTGDSELADSEAQPLPLARLVRACGSARAELAASVFPNPARGRAALRVSLPADALVTYAITDLLGRVLSVSAAAQLNEGVHTLEFDALPVGQYLIRVECQGSWGTQNIPVHFFSIP